VDLKPADFQSRDNVGLVGEQVENTMGFYVFIDIDGIHLYQTTTKQNTFCPVWNETFQSEVQLGIHLTLTVFHDATTQPDDFMANCSISFDELLNITKDSNSDIWVSSASCEIHFAFIVNWKEIPLC
jgi:novel protein kinase C epsilon type